MLTIRRVYDCFYSAWEIENNKFFEDEYAKIKARDEEAKAFLFSTK